MAASTFTATPLSANEIKALEDGWPFQHVFYSNLISAKDGIHGIQFPFSRERVIFFDEKKNSFMTSHITEKQANAELYRLHDLISCNLGDTC